jgi:hypothetical protein
MDVVGVMGVVGVVSVIGVVIDGHGGPEFVHSGINQICSHIRVC